MSKSNMHDYYEYHVRWSPEDNAWLATVTEYPSLSAFANTDPLDAIDELMCLVMDTVRDLEANGEVVQQPMTGMP